VLDKSFLEFALQMAASCFLKEIRDQEIILPIGREEYLSQFQEAFGEFNRVRCQGIEHFNK
jgi:hypothetical protein